MDTTDHFASFITGDNTSGAVRPLQSYHLHPLGTMPATAMRKISITIGLLLVFACSPQIDQIDNPGEKILTTAITEAEVRGLLDRDAYLLSKPLIDKGIFDNKSKLPEKIGEIPVKPIEWIFSNGIDHGFITLDNMTHIEGLHEVHFSYVNDTEEIVSITIKLNNDLELLEYVNMTDHCAGTGT